MVHRPLRATHHPVEPGTTFMADGVHVQSTIGIADGEVPQALVQLTMHGRWNHGAADRLQVMLAADTARELGDLTVAGDAADRDVTAYLTGTPPDQLKDIPGATSTVGVAVNLPTDLFDRAAAAAGATGDDLVAAREALDTWLVAVIAQVVSDG